MRKLLIFIVVSLFAAALALSLSALYDAGDRAAVSIPELWPWIIDGFILAMSLVIVEARRQGRRVTVWPRIGLYGVTGVSAWIQWVYASAPASDTAAVAAHVSLADHALHASAPIAALWSFECLMWLLYGQRAEAVEPESNRPVEQGPTGPVEDPVDPPRTGRLAEVEPPRLNPRLGEINRPGSDPVDPPSTAPVEPPVAEPSTARFETRLDKVEPPRPQPAPAPPTARGRRPSNRPKPPTPPARSTGRATTRSKRGRPSPEEIQARAERAETFIAEYLTEYQDLPSGGAVAKAAGAPDPSWGRAFLREHGERLRGEILGASDSDDGAEVLQLHHVRT